MFSELIGAEGCSSGEGASDEVGEVWDAEVGGGCSGGEFIELGQFLVGAGEADLQSFDLAEPAFAAGFIDAGAEVVADLDQAGSLVGVRA
ncbi:hypothetical protein [Mycolicibacterium tusciae]|uniref:hypothetical protein n=1 Tax=Mycolicibacterium tusciae TaxID=75922 RepID=UPI00024A1B64|nr:hypothetical protein [Mycolicibacterium tusciae]